MGDFNWKIWAKKRIKKVGIVMVASGVLATAEFIGISELPVEYAAIAGLSVIILEQIGNWFKHTYLV